MQIFDGAGQTVAEMRAKTRKMMNQFPNKKPIFFIDYLTLIHSGQSYGGNSHLQVTEISKSIKKMAKDFNCPVICLAQLNRSVESRANKRPMMYISKIDFDQADHQKVAELIQNNVLGFHKVGIYSLKMNQNEFMSFPVIAGYFKRAGCK